MPELPEVETVRDGLQRWVAGRTVAAVEVHHPRAVRRHPGGGADLAARLAGLTVESAARRGKYLWLPLAGPDHEKTFTAQAAVAGELYPASTGSSKKEAEQLAAETAWRAITATDVIVD